MADVLLQRFLAAGKRAAQAAQAVTPAVYPQPQTYLGIVLQDEIAKATRSGDKTRVAALDRVREAAGLPRAPDARRTA